MGVLRLGRSFSSSIGLSLLASSSRDMKVLLLLRTVRLFAFGGAALIISLFLSELGFSNEKVGLFMTLTLAGDLLISLAITWIGDRLGTRFVIVVGCLAMIVGGVAFAFFDNFWFLLLAAIVAVINPSGNQIDPFKAVEESAIARVSKPEDYTDYFAWWTLLGMLGTASSTLATGFVVDKLQALGSWTALESYRAVFAGYAVVSLLRLCCCLFLSEAVEPHRASEPDAKVEDESEERLLAAATDDYDTFTEPAPAPTDEDPVKSTQMPLRSFMRRICLVLALDFIGSGLVQIPWMVYFFKRKYTVNEGSLGLAMSIAYVISSLLNLTAAPLSRQIGQIPTIILTHILNTVFLFAVSLPNNRTAALVLFFLRLVTRELDGAPRQAFISAGVLDDQRTSAMGLINAVKIVGSGLGLFLTGIFAGDGNFTTSFVLSFSLKMGYNLLMTVFFWKFWRSWMKHE